MESKEIDVAILAAKIGGWIIRDRFDQALDIQTKGEWGEIVTSVDQEAEDVILTYLHSRFPSHGISSEESSAIVSKNNLTWFVDPLDGTSNLVLGISYVAVSVALCNTTEVLLGVVYNPMRSLLYVAEIQGQATLNGKPLCVSTVTKLENSTIAHIVSYQEKRKRRALDLVTQFRQYCYRFLDTWAPSLDWCLLGQGKVDALISLGSGQLDQLAGALIVQKAGGLITDLKGNEIRAKDLLGQNNGYFIASNGTDLHSELCEIMSYYYK